MKVLGVILLRGRHVGGGLFSLRLINLDNVVISFSLLSQNGTDLTIVCSDLCDLELGGDGLLAE